MWWVNPDRNQLKKKRMGLSFIRYYQNYIPLAPCWLPQSDDCVYTHTCINLWQHTCCIYNLQYVFCMWRQGWNQKPGTFLRPRHLMAPWSSDISGIWLCTATAHTCQTSFGIRSQIVLKQDSTMFHFFRSLLPFFPSHDMYKVSPHATGEHSRSWSLQIHLHIGKFMHITFLTHIVFVGHIPFACSLCFENREFSGAVQLKLREIERGTFSAPWQLQRAADGRGTHRDAAWHPGTLQKVT